jgi:EAL domain-containing protein (putative c-di-GMP-specific phosphodiesterase class I)
VRDPATAPLLRPSEDSPYDPLAIARAGRFGVQYEPLVDVWSGRLHGHEALARFHRHDGVAVPPPVLFSRLAAEPELLGETELALKRLQLDHAPGPRLFINVSGEAWAVAGAEPFLKMFVHAPLPIVVEAVESVHAAGARRGRQMLRALARAGIPTALDDLGGRDVLVSAEELHLAAVLKLDRCVVRNLHQPTTRALAEALVSFAERTGKLVVAEGVETDQDLDLVRALGVGLAQGDLFREAALRVPPHLCAG